MSDRAPAEQGVGLRGSGVNAAHEPNSPAVAAGGEPTAAGPGMTLEGPGQNGMQGAWWVPREFGPYPACAASHGVSETARQSPHLHNLFKRALELSSSAVRPLSGLAHLFASGCVSRLPASHQVRRVVSRDRVAALYGGQQPLINLTRRPYQGGS